ncbi:MAG: toxin-activating lysine-acyltransferase [Hyphomicrobiales bacterium]|nr:toxin-activating lysine-acyltransferase [Hyphomicrobiales bacterium]
MPGNVIVETVFVDGAGNLLAEPERKISYKQVDITGEAIGSIFGSSLGQIIGGDNVFAQVVAGSALSAVLSNVGQTLDLFFKDGSQTNGSLSESAIAAFDDFGANLGSAFASAAVGAVSSFLTAELAEALGFDGTSFGDQLLRAGTGQLINVVVSNAAKSIGLFNGLLGGGGDPLTAVASFVGSYLAKEIYTPETLGGSIGASIGSSLGTLGGAAFISTYGAGIISSLGLSLAMGTAASVILGVVTLGIGAFVGTLLGAFLGDVFSGLFGPPAHFGSGTVALDPGQQDFVLLPPGGNYGDVINGLIYPLQMAATTVLNAYLDAIGGEVVGDTQLFVNFSFTTDGPSQSMSVAGTRLTGDTASLIWETETDPGGTTGQHAIDFTVVNALKNLHVAGGNLWIKRAIANSTATTLAQLSGEIKIAEDYGRYLANKDIIDTLIALNPNSAFAAGWIVTLLRAEELGITALDKSDFYGGLVPFLQSFGLERLGGASLADVSIALEGDTLVISIGQGAGLAARRIEIENYAQLTGLDHLTASPTGALVEGGNGDDLWIAAAGIGSTFTDVSQHLDTLSNDVLIGNTGADTINAGVGADLIFGGGGNDTIDAGTGDDVVTGGTGNDTLQGGLGDDVLVFNRGDGTDTISDNGVTIARVVVNGEYVRDPETYPLLIDYAAPVAVGTVVDGGQDSIQFGRGIAVSDGADSIAGTANADIVLGNAGNDTCMVSNSLLRGCRRAVGWGRALARPSMVPQRCRVSRTARPGLSSLRPRATVSAEERLAAGTSRLRPQDWKSGERLRVVEVAAPFGGTEEMVQDLKAKVFPQRELRFLSLGAQGREVRVV